MLAAMTAASAAVALTGPAAEPITTAASADAVPGLGVELPELRTATSRTYEAEGGKRVAQISSAPIHYRDATGAWQPIDNTLVSTMGSLRNRANAYAVDLPLTLGAEPVRMRHGDAWVSFGLRDAAPTAAVATGAEVRYPEALPGVELTYAAGTTGVKETMVLSHAGATASFAFDVQMAAGLTPHVLDSGAIALVDAGGTTRLSLAAPFMVDAAGARSDAVTYTLARSGAGWSLGVAANREWLAAASRAYPVAVDPTVSIPAPVRTCTIEEYSFGGEAPSSCGSGLIGAQPDLDFERIGRTLLKWDLGSIPPTASVTDAAYESPGFFHYTPADGATTYPLTRRFTEATTWTTSNGSTPWTTPGGDYDAGSGANAAADQNGNLAAFDLTAITQDWVDGSRDNHGIIVIADDEEQWGQLDLMPLEVTYTVSACPSDPFTAAQGASATTVYNWNEVLLGAFRQGGPPGPLARGAAMLNIGIYDVLNSVYFAKLEALATGTPTTQICGWEPYLVLADTPSTTNADLAAGYAARDILTELFPGYSTQIASAWTTHHGSTPHQQAAEDLGTKIAAAVIASRMDDGSSDEMSYTPDDSTPGAWRPTDDDSPTNVAGCATAATPDWGLVTPFALSSGSQVRQPLPFGFTSYSSLLSSYTYAAQVNEVKQWGKSNSTSRTSGQTDMAWFWANDLDGTYKPPGQLIAHTRLVAESQPSAQTSGTPAEFFRVWSQQGVRVARLFARVSLAMADGAIAAWDQKYRTAIDLWRPQSAIRHADLDGNFYTTKDETWKPLSADELDRSFSPCFPAWVSGHATFGGTWAQIMESEFAGVDADDPFPLTLTTVDPHQRISTNVYKTRQVDSFDQAARENALSRIFLGVHYRVDADDGLETGRAVAEHVMDTRLRWNKTCAAWGCAVTLP
jgi:hypothetical protein